MSRIDAIPSTWPDTICPPSSSPARKERSRLTLVPGVQLSRVDFDNVSFDTSTGHNHDGSNSRLVTFPHQKLITPVQKASLSASTGYVTVDITADVTPDTARAAILSVALSAAVTASTSSGELWLRKKGETAEGIYLRDYKSTPNAITVTSITDFFVIVDVDSAEQFEYKFTETGVASCVIDLRGYITLD